MKNFAKWCGIIAAIFFAVGLILCGIATVVGGTTVFHAIRTNENWVYSIESAVNKLGIHPIYRSTITTDLDGDWSGEEVKSLIVNGEDYGSIEDKTVTDEFEVSEMDSLDLELGAGSFYMKDWEKDTIGIEFQGIGRCTYQISGSELMITGFEGRHAAGTVEMHNKITIYLPKDYQFSEVTAQLGAGRFIAEDTQADTMSIQVGAAECQLSSIQCEDLTVEVGAGSVVMKDITAQNMNAAVAVGSYEVEGTVAGDLTADCGMGSMEFHLKDQAKNHNFDIECAMGQLSVDGTNYAGLAAEKQIDNGADSDYTLNCNMGNLRMYFQ